MEHIKLDYYYGMESEQFAFFRIPKILMTGSRYKGLSVNSKMLYGLMLDRMSLSRRNNWIDEEQKVFIIYSVDEAAEELGCSKPTAVKAMAELKEIGLIEKKRRGQGCPDHIYVMNFISYVEDADDDGKIKDNNDTEKFQKLKNLTFEKNEENFKESEKDSKFSVAVPFFGNSGEYNEDVDESTGSKDVDNDAEDESQKLKILNSRNLTSRKQDFLPQEVKDFAPNNTEYNNTELNNTSISNHINQSNRQKVDEIDLMDQTAQYMKLIRENIEYDIFMQDRQWKDRELFEELYQIICDIVCVPRKTVRISGEEYPYELVKSKFLKLKACHLEYVILCMENNTTKVGNIKSYLTTALYNAPNTMNHYYSSAVNHDLYGA